MLNGSCDATAPAPSAMPERCRKVRRSIVLPRLPETERASRPCAAETAVDFLVSSMGALSDFGGFVVLADVLGQLVALRPADGFGFLGLGLRTFGSDRGSGGGTTGTNSKQELAAG